MFDENLSETNTARSWSRLAVRGLTVNPSTIGLLSQPIRVGRLYDIELIFDEVTRPNSQISPLPHGAYRVTR